MTRTAHLRAAAAAALLLCTAAEDASSQSAATPNSETTARTAAAVRVEGAPMIDGRLDEEVWRTAPALGGFLQRIPRDGAPASEETEVRVLFDAQALYVGVWLRDTNPAGIVPGEAIRDSQLDESDAVVLVFDTYHDRQNGFVFGTNPAGIEFDGQVANGGQGGGFGGGLGGRQQGGAGGGFNLNWDGSWRVATSRDAAGWYAEFRIPFSTLRYGPGDEQVWGFNVMRRIRRHNEESFWAPVPRQFSLFRLESAGTLGGLAPPFRRAASVTPYVLGSARRDYLAGDARFRHPGDVGGDAKLQLTQGMTLDLTLNTDFAQVEVDDQQVNLSRFSLFFPEKRSFFLENAGFFNVGGGGNEMFFSRRIGIVGGQPVPIQGGGRLSGRTMGMNVGMLHIRTGTEGADLALADVAGEAFSVVRIARELPNRSRIGGFFGDRSGLGGAGMENRTYAVDAQAGIGQGLNLSSFAARTETPGRDGRDHAFHLSGSFANGEWQGSASYREMGADFNPGLGFVPRTDYRTYSGFLMHYIRPERSRWLREIRPHAFYNTFRSLETGFEQSARVHLDAHFEAPNGTFFSPAFDWVREGLESPFRIAPDVVVQPGTYEGWTAAWRFNTNRSALLAFDGGFDVGSFLSGDRRGVHGTVTARPGSSLLVSLRTDYNDVRLAEGDFTATLLAARVGYFFTPRIYLQSLVQYSDQLDTWSTNVRFGWLGTAGTGLFVVLNDARGIDELSGPLNRSVIVKFSRQFDLR